MRSWPEPKSSQTLNQLSHPTALSLYFKCYNHNFFEVKIVSSLASGSPFRLVFYTFDITLLLFCNLITFWPLQDALDSTCTFSVPNLKSAIFPKSPNSLCREKFRCCRCSLLIGYYSFGPFPEDRAIKYVFFRKAKINQELILIVLFKFCIMKVYFFGFILSFRLKVLVPKERNIIYLLCPPILTKTLNTVYKISLHFFLSIIH